MTESGAPINVRDADLLEKLEAAQSYAPRLREIQIRTLERMQAERDREAAEAEAKQIALAALPRDRRRRAVIREIIEQEGPDPNSLRFMPTPLAICGLPYRRMALDTPEFIREQGRMRVVVTSGKATDPNGKRIQQPIPWGPKARLIMAHLSTEALKNRSPVIEIAPTFTAFIRDLGFERTGGERGNIKPFKEQLQALAACRMEISAWDGKSSTTLDVKPFSTMQLWFSPDPDQQSLWPSQ